MKILVAVKRVADPDNANKVKVSADASKVVSDGLEWKLNPFDDYAIEAALRLTENAKTGERKGEIVVVSLGPKDASATIRQALAMGADRGILIHADDAQLDSAVVARALAKIVAKESPDLVLMGKQAVDGESAATGAMLAELLGWPMSTQTMRLTVEAGGKTLLLGRELDTGVSTIRVTLPAVLTASDRILKPDGVKNGITPDDFRYPEATSGRYAKLKDIMASKKKPVEELELSALGIDTQLTTAYGGFQLPAARSGKTTFVDSVGDLVQRLRTEAKVL